MNQNQLTQVLSVRRAKVQIGTENDEPKSVAIRNDSNLVGNLKLNRLHKCARVRKLPHKKDKIKIRCRLFSRCGFVDICLIMINVQIVRKIICNLISSPSE